MGSLTKYWVCSILVTVLYGCAWSEPVVNSNDVASTQKSYVYGKFSLARELEDNTDSIYVALQLDYLMTPDFEIKKYVEFKEQNPIYAIAVPPGVYRIGKIAFFKRGMPHEEKALFNMFSNVTVTLEPGKAYYVGDYSGWSKKSPPDDWTVLYSWRFETLDDQFQKTTTEFEKRYPHFSNLEKTSLYNSITQPSYSGVRKHLLLAERYFADRMFDLAATLFLIYAKQGVPYAQLRYGQMLEKGLGVKASALQAGHWYKKSAELGNTQAMVHLGRLIMTHKPETLSVFGGKNHAMKIMEKAANRGNTNAMVEICSHRSFDRLDKKALARSYAWCEVGLRTLNKSKPYIREQLLKRKKQAKAKIEKLDNNTKRLANNLVYMYKNRSDQLKFDPVHVTDNIQTAR